MFDSHTTEVNITAPKEIHRHEHKAPTDDSIRILKEMEEKILEKIAFQKNIANNCFDGEWSILPPGPKYDLTIIGNMKFNGTPIRLILEFDGRDLRDGVDTIVGKIKNRVSDEIANLVVRDMFNNNDLTVELGNLIRK